jgi:hypothetical protein
MTGDDKIQLSHPEGKKAPSINKVNYELLEKAIIAILKTEKELSHSALSQKLREYFVKNKLKFEGSVEWYGEWVKLHLIAKGVIKTRIEKGKKLNLLGHLILKTQKT